MTTGWPNILWQIIILQLNITCHECRNSFCGQLNVLLVCLTIQIKRGILWDLRNLWCGFSARTSFNSQVISTIPEFTTTTPEPTQTGRSTGFWVGIHFDWHNNSVRCIAGFKQFNYAGGWEVTSLCIVVSDWKWPDGALTLSCCGEKCACELVLASTTTPLRPCLLTWRW